MNDSISRQAAIDCFWDENRMVRDCSDIIKDIRSLPSAQPDPKKGKWIVSIDGDSFCSVCGASEEKFIYGTEMWYGKGESNFCPCCGADLR